MIEVSWAIENIQGVKIVDITQESYEESEETNLEVFTKRKRYSHSHLSLLSFISEGPLRGEVMDIESHVGSDTQSTIVVRQVVVRESITGYHWFH